MSDRLRHLESFNGIKDFQLPAGFAGKLRPYQKAGYNWLRFLNDFHLGGCLADDMGLGKTVQTLLCCSPKRERQCRYFTARDAYVADLQLGNGSLQIHPDLRILTYTGTQRNKDVTRFSQYDIILTSYGITRLDIEMLANFYFNYVILDESQVIKNPTSNIAKAVLQLKSRYKLTLTGTPLEIQRWTFGRK